MCVWPWGRLLRVWKPSQNFNQQLAALLSYELYQRQRKIRVKVSNPNTWLGWQWGKNWQSDWVIETKHQATWPLTRRVWCKDYLWCRLCNYQCSFIQIRWGSIKQGSSLFWEQASKDSQKVCFLFLINWWRKAALFHHERTYSWTNDLNRRLDKIWRTK